ncbi:hypothetical protein D8674_032005 [Pyrus ussuriensis x Pyrus communis]|uniref:Bifunctional inhibitor/plant lipid transfer protein/seed storage helical domain-containing protein n=1 Tax=Pyrus ussuriensis x Pyrus communis TaxID=2448454 RepID=A0A5N5F0R7_9ROSA|nr:hypothetical protein D8674_032005 [Pyrus ussuriensis x Pyrus communis]
MQQEQQRRNSNKKGKISGKIMRATGSLAVIICLLWCGVWEVVPMAKADTSPSQCKQEVGHVRDECRSAILPGRRLKVVEEVSLVTFKCGSEHHSPAMSINPTRISILKELLLTVRLTPNAF